MRLASIEIKNFRAFKGTPVRINLTKTGKNLLVYGENGSGKSSVFFALRDFLECEAKNDITRFPFRNIFIDTNDGYIKLKFVDPFAPRRHPNPQAKEYEWSEAKNETNEQLILEINKTKGFIDYKDLLRTYFLQQDKATVDIFDLLIKSILQHAENDLSRVPFGQEWQDINESVEKLNKRSPKQKEALIEKIDSFNSGLRVKLKDLQSKAQTILNYFAYDLTIELHFGGVSYNSENNKIEKQLIGLNVTFFKTARNDHHLFLNEAKLSAIAISIFFAALLMQPASRLRILALDDVLIGLDMSNRLPVLDILDSEFKEYQIFFFTYDRAWYEIVKQNIESRKAAGEWRYEEFFTGSTFEHSLPIYAEDKNFMARAKEYFKDNDYKAAVIYVRTEFEKILKGFCDKHDLKVRYKSNPKDVRGEDFWQAVLKGQPDGDPSFVDAALQVEVEKYRRLILNPLSHAEIVTIFKKEVEDTIKAVEKLDATLKAAPKKDGPVVPAPAAPAPAAATVASIATAPATPTTGASGSTPTSSAPQSP
jgi:hypothetical protein